jgi:UDP-N-acetylmuramoylalanine--D-glutamate ligase
MQKKIAILGAGESGVGAALLAKKLGFQVFVSDKGQLGAGFKAELIAAEISFEEGFHTQEYLLAADEIVKSPGIPDSSPLVLAAIAAGLKPISEIEFAYKYRAQVVEKAVKIVGITGSNGKTTTTNLTYHLLKNAGFDVAVGGNIGKSFARLLVEEPTHDIYVLELSSFQLDGIDTFNADIAILLNITPDHLDRYAYKMSNYVASKFRIALNLQPRSIFILNADDTETQNFLNSETYGHTFPKTLKNNILQVGTTFENAEIHLKNKNTAFVFNLEASSLKGPHNYFNAACALQAALFLGAEPQALQHGLNTFVNAPHRLEFIGKLKGIQFINDSKATNVDSVFWALKAMSEPTILILGGVDKGNDYSAIAELVRQKVVGIVAMGIDNSKIEAFFAKELGFPEVISAHTASAAFAEAYRSRKNKSV